MGEKYHFGKGVGAKISYFGQYIYYTPLATIHLDHCVRPTFKDIREENEFFDITLACDGTDTDQLQEILTFNVEKCCFFIN